MQTHFVKPVLEPQQFTQQGLAKDRANYLDAMGISRWVTKEGELYRYTIIVDVVNHSLLEQPLMLSLLTLLEWPVERCQLATVTDFSSQTLSQMAHQGTLWDMRGLKQPAFNATISSASLEQLMQGAEKKRQLWQTIVMLQSATTS